MSYANNQIGTGKKMKNTVNTKEALRNAATLVGKEAESSTETDYTQLLTSSLKQDASIKKVAAISDEKEEGIYGQAYLMYKTGRYMESAEIFRLLITINPKEPKYMMGLGACFHMMKEYPSAISTYTMATALDIYSPIAHFHLSDCYIQVGDPISAESALKTAIERAGSKPEFKSLREKSELSLEGLKRDNTK